MSAELKNEATMNPAEGEPKSAWAILPVWLIVLLGLLTYRGCLQVDSAGGFAANTYPPYGKTPPNLSVKSGPDGAKLYATYCAICHGPSGAGTPGQFPPLAGSDWVQAEGPNRIVRLIMNGIQGPITVNGQPYNNAMPPWKDVLTKDEEVAAIVTYIRSSWGNKASAVTAAEVKAIRAEEAGRGSAWSADELLKLPVK